MKARHILLRVNMSNLRRKIEPDPTRPHYILTLTAGILDPILDLSAPFSCQKIDRIGRIFDTSLLAQVNCLCPAICGDIMLDLLFITLTVLFFLSCFG